VFIGLRTGKRKSETAGRAPYSEVMKHMKRAESCCGRAGKNTKADEKATTKVREGGGSNLDGRLKNVRKNPGVEKHTTRPNCKSSRNYEGVLVTFSEGTGQTKEGTRTAAADRNKSSISIFAEIKRETQERRKRGGGEKPSHYANKERAGSR